MAVEVSPRDTLALARETGLEEQHDRVGNSLAPIRTPALRLHQEDITLYVTGLPAEVLARPGVTKADTWSLDNPDGYQRPPLERRFKGIADYVLGNEGLTPLMPQAIILNARKPLAFESSGTTEGWGSLTIPQTAFPLFEVDGQHRLGGLRRAVAEDPKGAGQYQVPVVIIDGVPQMTEAVTFYVLNTEQKRVPTDIAQRLIAQQMEDVDLRERVLKEGKAWIAQATKIVDVLNTTPGHPWHNKIGVPGVERGSLMRQVSFVQSLKPFLDGTPYEEMEPEAVAQILIMYWQALEELWPVAFEDPKEYVIQKTVGVFPLHALLLSVIARTNNRPTKVAFKKVFAYTRIEASFWHKQDGEAGKYAGAKGFKILATIIKERLPQLRLPGGEE